MIDLQDVPRRSPNSAFRVYDGQATIVLPDRAEVKVLNPVGSLVWERMDGARTVAQIVDAIVDEYDIEP
ncbi:MAG TPA: PqqD family protein, partial [Candidatus Polarisedimenticolia bacterium]|nr:PqqD family protein [Candidatus Polarisedimenticolia bacterium]